MMTSRTNGRRWILAGVLPAAIGMLSASACIGSEPVLPESCPLTACGDTCADTTSDSAHCGACDTPCAPGAYCSASACAYPTSCADLLGKVGPGPDGPYVIQPAGRTPFTVHCAGMSTLAPREYLTLLHTHENGATGSNVSAYSRHPATAWTTCTAISRRCGSTR
jgi:hypothetical protein